MAEENRNVNVKIGDGLTWVIIFFFWIFWLQSGWYRVDCALGVSRACQLIAAEKEYQTKVQ